MDDIFRTVPYCCGDKDCDQQWHLSHYWRYADGTYSECDTDGNHEDVDESDIPTADEERTAWQDYYRYVARYGIDPLHQVRTPATPPRKHTWQARVRNWIGADIHGLKVTGLRRRGRGPWIDPRKVPQTVREYFLLNEQNCIGDFKTFAQLVAEAQDCTITNRNDLELWLAVELDEPAPPWSAERTQAYLRKQAKLAIKKNAPMRTAE